MTSPDTEDWDPKSRERPDLANGARAFQYLQTQGAGTPSPEKEFILLEDPAHTSFLPYRWLMT